MFEFLMLDAAQIDREQRRVIALASLHKNWRLAESLGVTMSDEEIEREIQEVRASRVKKAK